MGSFDGLYNINKQLGRTRQELDLTSSAVGQLAGHMRTLGDAGGHGGLDALLAKVKAVLPGSQGVGSIESIIEAIDRGQQTQAQGIAELRRIFSEFFTTLSRAATGSGGLGGGPLSPEYIKLAKELEQFILSGNLQGS